MSTLCKYQEKRCKLYVLRKNLKGTFLVEKISKIQGYLTNFRHTTKITELNNKLQNNPIFFYASIVFHSL